MKDTSTKMPTFKIITLDDGTVVELKKLGLITYAQMSTVLKQMIGSIIDLVKTKNDLEFSIETGDSDTTQEISAMLVNLFTTNINAMIDFLHISTKLDIEYLQESVGIHDAIILIDGVLEVNKIAQSVADVKKLMSQANVARS